MAYALKWVAFEVKGVDRETRSLEGYASTSMPDYEGEVILPSAWKDSLRLWKKLKSRPKFLAYHQHKLLDGHSPVVGSIEWMEIVDDGLKFKASFANTDLGEEHLELYASGAMDAFSVGFIPQARERDPEKIAKLLDKHGIQADATTVDAVTTKAHILEVSCVVVGMNIGATVKAAKAGDEFAGRALARLDAAAGIIADEEGKAKTERDLPPETFERVEFDDEDEKDVEEKPAGGGWDETDDYLRYRLREPSTFQDGSMRTVALKEDKPRILSVMGRLKGESTLTKQNLMFPKADGWDMGKAKSYLADHPDMKKWVDGWEVKDGDVVEVIDVLRDLTIAYVDGQKQMHDEIAELKSAVESLALKVKSGAPGAGAVRAEPPKADAKDQTLAEMYLADIAKMGKQIRAIRGAQ